MSILTVRELSKSFAGVRVLHEVDLTIAAGQAVGLVGENGAGKSTLIKLLSGLYRADAGQIEVDGEVRSGWSPAEAAASGISVIHQELLLVPELTVAQNIMLGDAPRQRRGLGRMARVRDDREAAHIARGLLAQIGADELDVEATVGSVRPGDAQKILIARALRRDSRLLILDEPTAALTPSERGELFVLVRRLRAAGTAILLVSHHLSEVEEHCGDVTVLRNGHVAAHLQGDDITVPAMVHAMLDRSLDEQFPALGHEPEDEIVLDARRISSDTLLNDVDLTVRRGEIVGIAGLLGAGKTELARSLIGADESTGAVALESGQMVPRRPRHALRRGLLLVPEERKTQGLLPDASVYRNGVLSVINAKRVRPWFIRVRPFSSTVQRIFAREVRTVGIRYASSSQLASSLSGGNQQKLVIGRCLACAPQVLILDEPTRGVDVGSRREIYELIIEQAARGLGVIMISSDSREVHALSHRIVVLRDGRELAQIDPRGTSHDELAVMLSERKTLDGLQADPKEDSA